MEASLGTKKISKLCYLPTAPIGIKSNNIVLVGDSAGGNLVLGVTLLAIKNRVQLPNGILLAYPGIELQFFFMSLYKKL